MEWIWDGKIVKVGNGGVTCTSVRALGAAPPSPKVTNSYVKAMAAATLVERAPAISLSKMEVDPSSLKNLGNYRRSWCLWSYLVDNIDVMWGGEGEVRCVYGRPPALCWFILVETFSRIYFWNVISYLVFSYSESKKKTESSEFGKSVGVWEGEAGAGGEISPFMATRV